MHLFYVYLFNVETRREKYDSLQSYSQGSLGKQFAQQGNL